MRFLFTLAVVAISITTSSQELYVFSEPASNIPAHAFSVKILDKIPNNSGKFTHRLMPVFMYGISKKLMASLGTSFSDMHTPNFRYESNFLYLKYRFLSKDELHKHFRMAAYLQASTTKAPFHYDEINLMGDKSGIEGGIVLTQLWNKFAASATIANTQVLDESRSKQDIYPFRAFSSMNYSLSCGLLVLPREYNDYKQTNLNLYLEILGQTLTDKKGYFLDLAPAIQLIFNSNSKLNLGYRFQAGGNMVRMSRTSWLISFERTFLNAFRK